VRCTLRALHFALRAARFALRAARCALRACALCASRRRIEKYRFIAVEN
jgi:hypothetical protein